MKIALVTPAGPGTRNGNRHTALRWAAFLRAAGHKVSVSTLDTSSSADLMLALHARRSHASIKAFPGDKPLVVALTGTDVYRDIRTSKEAQESLELARRLIVLQAKAADELPARLRTAAGAMVGYDTVCEKHAVIGDAPFAVEKLKALSSRTGATQLLGWFNIGDMPHADVKDAMQRFAADVMPKL